MLLSFDLDSHIAKDVWVVFLNLLVTWDNTVAASRLNSCSVSWVLGAFSPLGHNTSCWSISSYWLRQVIFYGSLNGSSWGRPSTFSFASLFGHVLLCWWWYPIVNFWGLGELWLLTACWFRFVVLSSCELSLVDNVSVSIHLDAIVLHKLLELVVFRSILVVCSSGFRVFASQLAFKFALNASLLTTKLIHLVLHVIDSRVS